MTFTRRRLVISAALAASPGATFAQGSERVVRLILPNAVGSAVDALARAAQPMLAGALHASIVVDNQAAAGGIVALGTLARARPDGLTLAIVSNNVVILPSVLKSIPFKMPEDFTPIAMLASTPLVLVVNPAKISARNNRELVAILKSRPGKLNYGSGGNGTLGHLYGQQYLDETGTEATHVPYKGVGPMMTDLIGGQVDMGILSLPSVQAQLASGKLLAIGIGNARRVESAPDIPTFVEQGLPNFVMDAWIAVMGPKGLAIADVKRIHNAFTVAIDDPALRETLVKQGNTVRVSTPEEANVVFKGDLSKYAQLARKAGVEPS